MRSIKKIFSKKDWQYIHRDFTPELKRKKEWEEQGFDYEQTKEWIDIGMEPEDIDYCVWLRDIRKVNPEWVLNYGDDKKLREEYEEYTRVEENSNNISDSELSKEIIDQIKCFDHSYKPYRSLTMKQKSLVNKLISNKELKERYKKYGLCKECHQPNTWYFLDGWCQVCNSKHFRQEFENWTSGSPEIDRFIQKYQLEATNHQQVLEWIPYEQFGDVEYLAKGGFGKVYKAKWSEGQIKSWNIKDNKWKRDTKLLLGKGEIVLKSLDNSQNVTEAFLKEITCHKLFGGSFEHIVYCHGISRDPNTKNYLIVMEYMQGGDLRKYLNSNNQLNLYDKLSQLYFILVGLSTVHEKGLVHRDLHPGNILSSKYRQWGVVSFISDLGLSIPADEINNNGNRVYGVLPYVAPEVLRSEPYTQASDIYSWGIVAYELLSNLPPYVVYDKEINSYKEISHDLDLALKICNGLRPNLDVVKVPQLVKDLISRCWDADPSARPTASELYNAGWNWYIETRDKKDTEFYRQYKEIEKTSDIIHKFFFNLFSIKKSTIPLKTNPQAVYTSRLLNFKNLPEPQNSREINEQFYAGSKNSDLDLNFIEEQLENIEISQESQEQFSIQIPPK
ncbi:MAG: protein kinase [Candidatus Moeniiplasma glomeromycotorum]|nr:protein kinase [Candidatus Moeniiplasma glomeromycotorum]MCE8162393.1 protein kinase [Candidatus Moeniiplasma glomeromycotorum]MCE8166318.1 protein kinase [Candidatus Moeniiplasma glomeromycotorum]MCE8166800.1 protein kinase [Candidatus Moeniiplasma glomeromycotorum]